MGIWRVHKSTKPWKCLYMKATLCVFFPSIYRAATPLVRKFLDWLYPIWVNNKAQEESIFHLDYSYLKRQFTSAAICKLIICYIIFFVVQNFLTLDKDILNCSYNTAFYAVCFIDDWKFKRQLDGSLFMKENSHVVHLKCSQKCLLNESKKSLN